MKTVSAILPPNGTTALLIPSFAPSARERSAEMALILRVGEEAELCVYESNMISAL